MGKGAHMSYQCDNVLGKLYRIVSTAASRPTNLQLRKGATIQIDEDPRFNPATEEDIANGVDTRLCRLVIPPVFLQYAAEMKQQYDLLLWDVLLR